MLNDIKRGKKTEIDFLNGVFVALGKRHNIPTPVNETIVREIKFLESPKNHAISRD
jgi:2-dehydropantoate 2-reductase